MRRYDPNLRLEQPVLAHDNGRRRPWLWGMLDGSRRVGLIGTRNDTSWADGAKVHSRRPPGTGGTILRNTFRCPTLRRAINRGSRAIPGLRSSSCPCCKRGFRRLLRGHDLNPRAIATMRGVPRRLLRGLAPLESAGFIPPFRRSMQSRRGQGRASPL